MMSAPAARTSTGFIALTVAAVPTGMKAGVLISPRRIAIVPARAAPSVAEMEKVKRGEGMRGAPTPSLLPCRPLRARLSLWSASIRTLGFDSTVHLGIEAGPHLPQDRVAVGDLAPISQVESIVEPGRVGADEVLQHRLDLVQTLGHQALRREA